MKKIIEILITTIINSYRRLRDFKKSNVEEKVKIIFFIVYLLLGSYFMYIEDCPLLFKIALYIWLVYILKKALFPKQNQL